MSFLKFKRLVRRGLHVGACVNGSSFNVRLSTRRFRSSLADSVDVQTHVHDTCKLFDPALADEDTGLVILNNRSSISLAMIDGSMLGRSRTVVCADGGSNVLFDLTPKDMRRVKAPAAIIGDLDSVRPEVLSFYRDECDTEVVRDGDQDSHDLDKCLNYLHTQRHSQAVVVVGAFGGRLDHEMAALNSLYRWQGMFAGGLVLMSVHSLALLLGPGSHRILTHPTLEGPTCGLLPVGGACGSVTTDGLRWDLHDRPLGFGGLVSSSNALARRHVMVQCSDPVVWTTALALAKRAATSSL